MSWNDERLDDLKDEVVRQGARIDGLSDRVDALSGKVDDGFARLDRKVDDGFARLDGRIDSLNHTLAYVGAGLIAAFLSFLAALLGLIVTQL